MEVVIKEETPMEEDIHNSSEEAIECQSKIKTESNKPNAVVEDFNLQKSERVKAAVATYLKRRNFKIKASSNGNVQLLRRLCVDANEAKQLATMGAAVRNLNAVKFSPSNIDTSTLIQVDKQLTKLIQSITNLKDGPVKRELLFITPILLAHLYIELLNGASRKYAIIFLKKHFNAILDSGVIDIEFPKNFFKIHENISLIKTFDNHTFQEWLGELVLELMECRQEIDTHSRPILMLFRSMKQKVLISNQASIFLTQYLYKHAHVLIVHVLNRWFKYDFIPLTVPLKNSTTNVEESETDNPELQVVGEDHVPSILPKESSLPTCEERTLDPSSSTSKESNGLSSNIAVNDELQEMRETAHQMKNMETWAITNLLNAEKVTCAALDKMTSTKAFGFTNSDILLCNHSEENQMDLDLGALREKDELGYSWIRNNDQSLMGHQGEITSLRFTRTDPHLLSASRDTTVKLWNISTGCEVATYSAHHNPVWCVDISPNDYYFASGSQDCTARLWACDRTNPIRTFAGHISDIECIRFHSNERYVATGSKDTTVRIFSIFDGSAIRLFNGKGGSISTIEFSPDGKLLAAAGEDTHIQIWDIAMCKRLHLLPGHTDHIVSLAWDPSNQNRLLSGTKNGEVKLWICEGGNKWSVGSPCHKSFRRIMNIDFVQTKNLCIGNIFGLPSRSVCD